MPELQCHACGAPVTIGEPIPRDSECEACGHDLRCCTNCRHYDTRYNNSCRENMAELVEEKERRNFCEYFSFSREPHGAAAGGGTSAKQAEARARLDALFGGRPEPKRQADARAKLDALFRKPAAGQPSDEEKSGD